MNRYVLIAFRNLAQAPIRTLLLCSALGAVSLFLVVLLSLSQGLTDTLVQASTTLASGHVNVAGFYKAKPEDAYPMITRVDEIRALVKELPEVDHVLDRNRGWGKVISETSSTQVALNGIDIAEEKDFARQLRLAPQSDYKEGGEARVVGDIQKLSEPNTVLLFAAQAKRLGVGVGDVVTLTTEALNGQTNTGEVRVVAVAKNVGFMSNWNLFVPSRCSRTYTSSTRRPPVR